MGIFGVFYYFLNFFIDFYLKLLLFDDLVYLEVIFLMDGWKGFGLIYFLFKGLKNVSKIFKLIIDFVEGFLKKDGLGMSMGSCFVR